MLKYLFVVALCAVPLALTGCKSKQQTEAEQAALKAEQDKLQGKWKLASRSGDDDEDAPEPNSYYVIEGDVMRFVYINKDGKEEVFLRQKMAVTLDKEPKQLDLTYVDDAGKPITSTDKIRSRGKTKTKTTALKNAAIYQLDGDKLRICISYDDKKRPTDFTAPKGSARYVLNLEKMK